MHSATAEVFAVFAEWKPTFANVAGRDHFDAAKGF